MKHNNNAILLVANWDSSTGYAWWLMESFWVKLSELASVESRAIYLVYPSISTISATLLNTNIQINTLDFRADNLSSILKQYNFLKTHKVGTIYFSDYPGFKFKYLIFRLAGVKHIIVHDHKPGKRNKPGLVKKLLKKIIYRVPGISADGILAATDYVKKRNIETGCVPDDRCYSVPNGIPARKPSHNLDINKAYDIPVDRTIMVTTGRASKYKGIDFVLDTLELLINKKKRTDIHYIFCGDGPDINYFIEKVHNLRIDDYVTFAGQLDDVFPTLLGCDFAIHPSKGEVGYSLSVLEYMQAGLPVIVPDNPSVSGACKPGINGYIYREDNKEDAAIKIIKLLDNEDSRIEMGIQAKQDVLNNYKLTSTHEKLVAAFTAIEKAG